MDISNSGESGKTEGINKTYKITVKDKNRAKKLALKLGKSERYLFILNNHFFIGENNEFKKGI